MKEESPQIDMYSRAGKATVNQYIAFSNEKAKRSLQQFNSGEQFTADDMKYFDPVLRDQFFKKKVKNGVEEYSTLKENNSKSDVSRNQSNLRNESEEKKTRAELRMDCMKIKN